VSPPSQPEPEFARFRDALLDLFDAPSAVNVARYLNASRALDGFGPPRSNRTANPTMRTRRAEPSVTSIEIADGVRV
jgi:hypothetical protein